MRSLGCRYYVHIDIRALSPTIISLIPNYLNYLSIISLNRIIQLINNSLITIRPESHCLHLRNILFNTHLFKIPYKVLYIIYIYIYIYIYN